MLSKEDVERRREELRQDRRFAVFMDSLSALAQWLPNGYEQVYSTFDRDIAVVFYSDRLLFVTKRDPEDDEKTGRVDDVLEIEVRLHSQIVAIDTTIYPDWYNDYASRGLWRRRTSGLKHRGHSGAWSSACLSGGLAMTPALSGFPVTRDYDEFDTWIELQSRLGVNPSR